MYTYMYYLKNVCIYVFKTTASSCKRDGRRIAADHRRKQEPAGRSFFRFGKHVVNLKNIFWNMFNLYVTLYVTLIWMFWTCFGYIYSCTVISRYLHTLFYVEELNEVFDFRFDTGFLLKMMWLIFFFCTKLVVLDEDAEANVLAVFDRRFRFRNTLWVSTNIYTYTVFGNSLY